MIALALLAAGALAALALLIGVERRAVNGRWRSERRRFEEYVRRFER